MWFAFENEVVGTTTMYEGLPSKETVELLEDSELIRLNIEKIKERRLPGNLSNGFEDVQVG